MCTLRSIACSSSPGSCSSAGARNASPGMNSTTNSGAGLSAAQYALAASRSTCSRRCRACASEPGLAHRLVGGLGRLQVGGQRDLGVHHDVLAAGQPDHHVRAQRAVVGGHADLLVEVAPGAHPGQLDHPAQLHLPPPAAGLRPPQRGDQGLGLGAELVGALPGDRHLLGQRGVRPAAGPRRTRAAASPPGPAFPAAARPGAPRPPGGCPARPPAVALAALSRPSAISRNRRVLWSSASRGQRLEPLGELAVDQRRPLLRGAPTCAVSSAAARRPGGRARRRPVTAPITMRPQAHAHA